MESDLKREIEEYEKIIKLCEQEEEKIEDINDILERVVCNTPLSKIEIEGLFFDGPDRINNLENLVSEIYNYIEFLNNNKFTGKSLLLDNLHNDVEKIEEQIKKLENVKNLGPMPMSQKFQHTLNNNMFRSDKSLLLNNKTKDKFQSVKQIKKIQVIGQVKRILKLVRESNLDGIELLSQVGRKFNGSKNTFLKYINISTKLGYLEVIRLPYSNKKRSRRTVQSVKITKKGRNYLNYLNELGGNISS